MKYTSLLIGIALAFFGEPVIAAPFTTLVNNGKSDNRIDVVFLGDGYTSTDVATGTYDNHINNYVNYLFSNSLNSDPFFRYRNYFNIHKIDVISTESGADSPPDGVFRDTALDSSYYFDGVTDRLLFVNSAKANEVRDRALATAGFTAELQYVTVNDSKYGGGGGDYAVYAGGNSASTEVALHETGHSFSGLADEYDGFADPYTGPEPIEPNATTDPTGAKWAYWQGYDQPGIGLIGSYNGGRYYNDGVYRPSENSKMRSLYQPFDAISREQIILSIYDFVKPLDSWRDNSLLLTNPDELFVDVVDETVINLEWFIDGNRIGDVGTERLNLTSLGYGPGDYVVSARAFDPTGFDPVKGWVRKDQTKLEQRVSWTVKLTAGVTAVPEPSGAIGLLGLLAFARRKAAALTQGA
jgi:IgA Peptidase M64